MKINDTNRKPIKILEYGCILLNIKMDSVPLHDYDYALIKLQQTNDGNEFCYDL